MLISLIMAWLSVFFALMTALKYFARISKVKSLNHFFHEIHIPFGVIFLVTSFLHGVLAGNPYGTEWKDFVPAALLFTWNAGTLSLLIGCLLGISYLLRKILKKNWMILHRILTVLLICFITYHLCEMGITLPGHLLNQAETESVTESTESSAASSNMNADTDKTSETIPASSPEEVNHDPISSSENTEQGDNSLKESSVENNASEDTMPEETSADNPSSEEELSVTFSGATLKDGVYSGSAEGFKGTVTVQVTVESGAVTAIDILSNYDTPNYFSKAKQIISSILGGQTLEVAGVSGATFSSKGIRDAVYDALKDAVVDGELNLSTITVQGGGKRH